MNAATDQAMPDEKPAAPRVVVTTERRKPVDLSKTLLLDDDGIPLENHRRRRTDTQL